MIQQTSKAGKQGLGGHVGGEEGQWVGGEKLGEEERCVRRLNNNNRTTTTKVPTLFTVNI